MAKERPEEAAAARIVGNLLGTSVVRIDGCRPGSGLPDYEVEVAAETIFLEATTLTDGGLVAFYKALQKHGGRHVPGITESGSIVTPYEPINVRKLNAALSVKRWQKP